MRSRTDDGPLAGGTANRGRVVKVGSTVHRPSGLPTPAVHSLLRHLAASGFSGAPEVRSLGVGTEVLSYIDGAVALAPLPDWALTDGAVRSVGVLLRAYHRHACTFDVVDRQWQRLVPEPWRGDLVTHNDVHPANVVFRAGVAVALIDFDLAAPGTPAWDLAVAACFWAPLRDAADVVDHRRTEPVRRFGLLLDGYGAPASQRRDVAAALVAANQWIADIIEDNARRGHPAFGRLWERDREVHRRAAVWLAEHAAELQGV